MLGDPPVLMLDEPFNGLDPEGIVWIRGFLRALAAEGRAVLVSSHLMSELQDTAHHLVVVGRGRVIADTSVAELIAGRLRRPGHAAHDRARRGDDRAGDTPARPSRPPAPDTLTVSGLAAGTGRGTARRERACRSPRCPRTAPRWRRRTWS